MSTNSLIKRRKTRQIMVGNVAVGGDAPISVQTMTNTETCDVEATLEQISRMVTAGVDIVRVSVPSMDAAEAFRKIRATRRSASGGRYPFRLPHRAEGTRLWR